MDMKRRQMFRIENNKAIFIFDVHELWWLYHHLPPNTREAREMWKAITQLEKEGAEDA